MDKKQKRKENKTTTTTTRTTTTTTNKTVTYAKISPKLVNPRHLAGELEKEEVIISLLTLVCRQTHASKARESPKNSSPWSISPFEPRYDVILTPKGEKLCALPPDGLLETNA